MDPSRVGALWEFAIPGGATTDASALARVCDMYLGGCPPETQAELLALCEACVRRHVEGTGSSSSASASASGGALDLAAFLRAADGVGLGARVAEMAAGRRSAGTEGMATILGADLSDDDDDEDDDEDDDNDDEGSEDDSAAPPPPEPMRVVMRGLLKMSEGKLQWAGSWAVSLQAFDAGDKSKFKYVYSGSKDVSQCENAEGSKIVKPVSGQYSGSFLVRDETVEGGYKRVDENGVRMDFEPVDGQPERWKITGKGSNVHGEFTLEGELDGASRRMAVMKTYKIVPPSSSRDEDEDDDSFDSDFDDEEGMDANELDDLKRDAELPLETVVKRAKMA